MNETTLAIEMALAGAGIAYCLEHRIREHIRNGNLRIILAEWAPVEAPMYLYYPGHRQVPQGLKELIKVLRDGIESDVAAYGATEMTK